MTPDPTDLARALWGGALLVAPRRLLADLHQAPAGTLEVGVLRVLGMRHLVQAAVLAALSDPRARWVGAVVDLLHAGSAVPLAMGRGPRSRAGRVETLAAVSFAAAELAPAIRRTEPRARPRR